MNAAQTSSEPVARGTKVRPLVVIGAALATAWVAFAIGLALTRGPWSNEAWTAIPALNLAERGWMGTTVLEFRNTWLQGLDRHTYWLMPLHLVVQAAWYKLIGFGLLQQRLLSVFFGAVLLAAWSRIVLALTGLRAAAFAAWLIIGFEANFLTGAANGRMDMMCAALGSAGIAVWLELRAVAPRLALLAGHSLAAAAIFTHPCGALFAAALLLIPFLVGGGRPRPADLLIIAVPYLIAASLWGLYVARAPADFQSQFFGNASGLASEYTNRTRLSSLVSPVRAILDEVRLRYLAPFGFGAHGTHIDGLNAIWLLISCSAVVVALLRRDLRAQPGVRILLGLALLVFLLMALLEGMKFQHYLIHSLPFLGAVTAAAGGWLWTRHRKIRPLLIAAILALTLPQIQHVLAVMRRNPAHNELGFVANYLRASMAPGDLVMGGAELGYELGFNQALRDDVRLGYDTGLRPRFIVTSGWYRQWFERSRQRDPAIHAYIDHLLNVEYRHVLTRGDYQVYGKPAP